MECIDLLNLNADTEHRTKFRPKVDVRTESLGL